MVKGIDLFKKHFEQYPNNYVIIGGTACDIIIDDAGFVPRTTKDIDIILVVEALSTAFVKQFWRFIKAGKYQQREKSNNQREHYRFMKPENPQYPFQIELFSGIPDVIVTDKEAHLTPIPTDDNLSNLSAILLSDDYYNYIIEHSTIEDGLHRANIEALICLKAKAFLDIKERIEKGSREDSKQLKKHKADVFRLTIMLPPGKEFELPETIQSHINQFAELRPDEIPDKAIFKEMGLSNIEPLKVFEQFKKLFKVTGNKEL